jgi:hypothetical protein
MRANSSRPTSTWPRASAFARWPMSESLPEFHLAIIGGCMSHQRGTSLNALYHRVLAEMLRDDPGVRLRPHIVRDFGADLRTRLDRLLTGPPVDGVLVHLRAARMVVPVRLTRSVWRNGRFHQGLNPLLFRRGHTSSLSLSQRLSNASSGSSGPSGSSGRSKPRGPDAYGDLPDLQDQPQPGLRIAGFRVRNLNLAFGTLVGLDRWAIAEELHEFDEFERACRERGLPLFVLGPTPTTYSYWTDRIVRKGNAAIRRRLSGTNVPFALVEQWQDPAGRPLTRADGFHMTLDGHRFVAELLYGHDMREWVGGIVAAKG